MKRHVRSGRDLALVLMGSTARFSLLPILFCDRRYGVPVLCHVPCSESRRERK